MSDPEIFPPTVDDFRLLPETLRLENVSIEYLSRRGNTKIAVSDDPYVLDDPRRKMPEHAYGYALVVIIEADVELRDQTFPLTREVTLGKYVMVGGVVMSLADALVQDPTVADAMFEDEAEFVVSHPKGGWLVYDPKEMKIIESLEH